MAEAAEPSMQPVGLCGVPFNQLQDQAAHEVVRNKLEVDLPGRESANEDAPADLWVERYKPR